MAAGPVTIIKNNDRTQKRESWQLLKSLSIAQTAITAAKLTTDLFSVSFDEDTVQFVDVSSYEGIRCQVWGVASDNDAPVVDLYGWHDSGPGAHIGKVTLAYGAFTSAASTGFHASTRTAKSIRDAFAAATAYRGCDTYTVTNDYETETLTDSAAAKIPYYRSIIAPDTAAAASPIHADFPGHVDVWFTHSRYKYFGVLVTTLAGTTLGAIFRPIAFRTDWNK